MGEVGLVEIMESARPTREEHASTRQDCRGGQKPEGGNQSAPVEAELSERGLCRITRTSGDSRAIGPKIICWGIGSQRTATMAAKPTASSVAVRTETWDCEPARAK